MLNLYHTEIIHSSVIDWIKLITLKEHSPQLFSATEHVLKNILKNAIIVNNVANSIFTTCYYSVVRCGRLASNFAVRKRYLLISWQLYFNAFTLPCDSCLKSLETLTSFIHYI
jgi:hypothetical protein